MATHRLLLPVSISMWNVWFPISISAVYCWTGESVNGTVKAADVRFWMAVAGRIFGLAAAITEYRIREAEAEKMTGVYMAWDMD